jgi:DNA helicase-2/ATP-dependent DNA helicase PcrA
MKNKLMIASAGAGKTTYLINEALNRDNRVLITTYTRANENEIKKKIIEKIGYIPANIEIQTWDEFLLREGVRPFQGSMHDYLYEKNIGFSLVNKQSTKGIKESNTIRYFFTNSLKIYSDKISNFVIKCNEKTGGKVLSRIIKMYSHIFIDEVQDLVGYDLDLIKHFILSTSEVILVGDPRQTVYTTHPSKKYPKYKNGKIDEFIINEINKKKEICKIDPETLNISHRNDEKICSFSSKLYPNLPISIACSCSDCRNYIDDHIGIYFVKEKDIMQYITKYLPVQLRWNIRTKGISISPIHNFGESKGLSFDRVLIYPTEEMKNWLNNNSVKLKDTTKAKFYVAITRARKSVAIVVDDKMMKESVNHDYLLYIPQKNNSGEKQ